MARTYDIFIPNKKRDELGRFLTAMKGLRREAIVPPPRVPRLREHQQAIPQLRTPNQYNGAFVERYEAAEESCDCDPCVAKRTAMDAFEENEHKRDTAGKFAIMAPGTAPIPEGTVRRFHYTPAENIESIVNTGIGKQYSHGRAVGDPIAVWSNPDYPYPNGGIPDDKAVIEFFHDPKNYESNPYATYADVPPENIVAVHEAWHEVYNLVKNGHTSIKNLRRVAKPGRGNEHYIKALEVLEREGTKDYSPYYAPVYTEVPQGVLPFEAIWEQALGFPARARISSYQRIGTGDDFVESQHPRGQPDNKGEFAKTQVKPGTPPSKPSSGSSAVGVGNTIAIVNPNGNDLYSLFDDEDGPFRALYQPGTFAIWPAEEMLHQPVMRFLKMDDKSKRYIIYKRRFATKQTNEFRMGKWYVIIHGDNDRGGVPAKLIPEAVRKVFGVRTFDAGFIEAEHPRGQPENAGEFAEKAGGNQVAKGLVPALPDRSDFPEHIKKLVLPPAWTNIHYNPDPTATLLATGRDKKNQLHSVYSQAILQQRALAKFSRVKALEQQFIDIAERNEYNRQSKLPLIRDVADTTKLIMETGIRPGSTKERGNHKAYGATTLEGRHVIADASGVSLTFVPGKKHGAEITIPVTDKSTANMLRRRKVQAGDNGQLFPAATDKNLSGYIKQLSGGNNHTKDFRTLVANSTALGAIKMMPAPTSEHQYKKAVLEVARRVASKIGNTATVALSSYINPVVFAEWRAGIIEGQPQIRTGSPDETYTPIRRPHGSDRSVAYS